MNTSIKAGSGYSLAEAYNPRNTSPKAAAEPLRAKDPLALNSGSALANQLEITATTGQAQSALEFTNTNLTLETQADELSTDEIIEVWKNTILNYPGCQASPEDARLIAIYAYNACLEFKVDPYIMLAIFAHESEGFNKNAVSYTGAKGLGQLTGIAIEECQRVSKEGVYIVPGMRSQFERADVRAVFNRVSKDCFNIGDNIWTSVPYTRIMMDRVTVRGSVDVNTMLRRYNAAGGAEERAFPGKVAQAYRKLWGQDLPTQITNHEYQGADPKPKSKARQVKNRH